MENFKNFLTHLLGKTDKHGNPYTKIDGKKYLINPTKNITVYGTHGHPAYIRYPHLKPQPTDVTYTAWQKVFAWLPKNTVSGDRVWFKYLYRRQRIVEWTAPQFPVDAFNRTEYETIENVVMRKLSGEN